VLTLSEFAEQFLREVRAFNRFVAQPEGDSAESLEALARQLTRLLALGENCPDAYSEEDAEPPDQDVAALRSSLTASFPSFGFYYMSVPDEAGAVCRRRD
jgi:hypothetical protein